MSRNRDRSVWPAARASRDAQFKSLAGRLIRGNIDVVGRGNSASVSYHCVTYNEDRISRVSASSLSSTQLRNARHRDRTQRNEFGCTRVMRNACALDRRNNIVMTASRPFRAGPISDCRDDNHLLRRMVGARRCGTTEHRRGGVSQHLCPSPRTPIQFRIRARLNVKCAQLRWSGSTADSGPDDPKGSTRWRQSSESDDLSQLRTAPDTFVRARVRKPNRRTR